MTKPNKESVIRENDTEDTSSPPGVMFTTILLLIIGLLLTSSMLIHYGMGTTDEKGKSTSGLAHLLERVKRNPTGNSMEPKTNGSETLPADSSTPTQDTADKPSGFSLRNLFAKDGNVRWPRLKLSGFGQPSKGKVGFAIINGKHILEGNTIKDVTVVKVLDQGVQVEYKGETKTLTIEMTD